jgi:ribose transport system ATP-binding protein
MATTPRSGADMMPAAALLAAGIVKAFGAQLALDHVDLTLRAGEVHGLLGENGSGKSTLIKILCGYYRPDGGQLAVGGRPVALPLAPGQAAQLGLQVVHQDLGLIPTLSVAENLALPSLARGGAGVSDRRLRARAAAVLGAYGVDLDPRAVVTSLPAVDRALLAIVRAVDALAGPESATASPASGATATATRLGGRVLILDEPTVFLPRADVERVFGLVRRLTADGCAVLLVSHDLDEILEVTDRVTVLRDGRLAGTRVTSDCRREDLVGLIVGGQVIHAPARATAATDRAAEPARIEVAGLSGAVVEATGFTAVAGEILGLTGLAGSGYEEVCYLLYGARRARAGTLRLGPDVLDLPRLRPHRALAEGITLLPADRRRTAGIGTLTVDDNVTLPRLRRFRQPAGLRRRAMLRDTESLLDRFDVRPRDPKHAFGTLSGGNQQKALLAKWLAVEPRLLLVDEPTQGVDIGARAQIFRLLRAMADTGRTVICSSTDHEQLAALTDRTLVFGLGRPVAELGGADLTKQRLTQACFDTAADHAGRRP